MGINNEERAAYLSTSFFKIFKQYTEKLRLNHQFTALLLNNPPEMAT